MTTKTDWVRSDLPADLQSAVDAVVGKQGRCPRILRVTDVTGYTDWVLLVSAKSERQVKSVANAVIEELGANGRKNKGTDGFDQNAWVLLDYCDFIVHVFYHPVRLHFDLESMWKDAPEVDLGLPAEVMDVAGLEDLTPPDQMPEFRGTLEFGGFDDEFDPNDLADIDESRLQDAEKTATDELVEPKDEDADLFKD